MLGSIGGDIAGSIYEYDSFKNNTKLEYSNIDLFTSDSRMTDDSILTLAIADAIISNISYETKIKEYIAKYIANPRYEESKLFFKLPFSRDIIKWSISNSCGFSNGNGAAMRISSIPYLFNDYDEIMEETKKATIPSHNTLEAINGAQAVASAIFFSRKKYDKLSIKKILEDKFKYNFNMGLEDLRFNYRFYINCDNTVPQAIFIFLITNSYEECIKTAISIGGDTDTLACIAGGIAEAYYGIPDSIKENIISYLNKEEKLVMEVFNKKIVVY